MKVQPAETLSQVEFCLDQILPDQVYKFDSIKIGWVAPSDAPFIYDETKKRNEEDKTCFLLYQSHYQFLKL